MRENEKLRGEGWKGSKFTNGAGMVQENRTSEQKEGD
jgi:hypothetical protein